MNNDPVNIALDRQKRVATPAEAIRDGANYLVIGREVTRAANPAAALAAIHNDLALATVGAAVR